MEGMKKWPDKYFDLAIVDPPYGINAPRMAMGQNINRSDGYKRSESTAVKLKNRLNHGNGKLKNRILNSSLIDWDISPPKEEYFSELFRISKNQIIWGGNYFNLPATRCIICWDKIQPWENFSQWEMAWTSFDLPAKIYRISNTGGSNVEKKIHPTQKPVKLYDRLLNDFSKPGMKILDTHVGSGSSRIASFKKNLKYTGYEICKYYHTMQENRFKIFTSQLRLFND